MLSAKAAETMCKRLNKYCVDQKCGQTNRNSERSESATSTTVQSNYLNYWYLASTVQKTGYVTIKNGDMTGLILNELREGL